MEGLWDKYSRIKEVFYRDFVYDSSYTEQASCIPLSSVKDGVGWVGEGIDGSRLESYLKEWEWDGVNSPIEFLTLCNWHKIFFGNENIL